MGDKALLSGHAPYAACALLCALRSAALSISLLGAASLAAQTTSPGDYSHQASIDLPTPGAPFYRVELALDVLRATQRADRADLRVFDLQGKPVPYAWAGTAQNKQGQTTRETLGLFVLRVKADQPQAELNELQVQRNATGAVVSLRYRQQAGKQTRAELPESYLLQRAKPESKDRGALTRLHLSWQALPGAQASGIASLDIESSDDLKNWTTVLRDAPLVDLRQGEATISRRLVELPSANNAPFFRLRLNGAKWLVTEVQGEWVAQNPGPALKTLSLPATKSNANEVEFDLGGALPVQRLALRLAQINSVVPIQWLSRDSPEQSWRPVSTTVAYRLANGGREQQSPPVEIGLHTSRYWLARVNAGAANWGATPTLEAWYAAPQLVLLASGAQARYLLAFGQVAKPGQPGPTSQALPLATLLPGFSGGDQWKLPQAQLGAAQLLNPAAAPAGAGGSATAASWLDKVERKTLMLWATLVLAVLVLGTLAYRMVKAPN